MLIQILVLMILLMMSALISGAEVALFGLSKTAVEEITASSEFAGKRISKLLEKPKKLLATILIANNAINIAVVLLFAELGSIWFEGNTAELFGIIKVRTLLDIAIATILILLFGEILPKIYANRNRASFSVFMSRPLLVLDLLFGFASTPMQKIMEFLEERLAKQKSNISVNHLTHALELASEKDTTQEEKKILEGIVTFGNTDTKQVMRPRIDIFAISNELSYQELLKEIQNNGYSRIPVYQEHIDTVIGVLYVKDLLPYLNDKDYNWVDLLREPYFVPENKKLDDLLVDFQEQKKHLAVVVDEYGGTSGIVTLEDIIEEIVGDISDEFDDDDLIYSKIDHLNFVFEGKTNLKDFYRVTHIEDFSLFEASKGESETIAGFVLEIAQGFPKRGEAIRFHNYKFVVESLDNRRLKQIKVTLPNEN